MAQFATLIWIFVLGCTSARDHAPYLTLSDGLALTYVKMWSRVSASQEWRLY